MKNVNKNNLRILLIGLSIGGLIFGGIGVAAGKLTADQIKYTPSNEKFTATNAEEALNEIYKIAEYEIPENTYFYEDGTEGAAETIVRYKKINDEYYICDSNGMVAEGTSATDVTSKILIPYSATFAGNLSAGSAGYASGNFYLGDGSDNAAVGTFSLPAKTTTTIDLGYKPSIVIATCNFTADAKVLFAIYKNNASRSIDWFGTLSNGGFERNRATITPTDNGFTFYFSGGSWGTQTVEYIAF